MERALWRGFLAAGVVMAAAYFVVPEAGPAGPAIYSGLTFATVGAIVTGMRRYRPRRQRAWGFLAVGFSFYGIANAIWFSYPPFPSAADAFFLLAYTLLVIGLITAVRARTGGRDRGSVLDSLIVIAGVGVLSWVFLMSPQLEDSSLSPSARLVALAYPVVDLVILGALARQSFVAETRAVSFRLLALGFLAQLSADTGYAVTVLNGSFHYGHPIQLGYLMSYALIGAAALHPSMRVLTEEVPEDHYPARAWRLGLLGASALVPTVVLIGTALRGSTDNVVAIATFSGLLFVLVLARVGQLLSDLTERRRMEDMLREAERNYRQLVEHLPGVVYTAAPGPQGRWTYVSPQIESMLGFTPEEWMADPELWFKQLHEDDRERVERAEATLVEEGNVQDDDDEYRLMARDGRTVWVRDEARLVRDENGEPLFFRGVLLDITERKALEDQLRQSQKMEAIGLLAGGIAHDFNNLLSVVHNYARFIADELPVHDPKYQDCQEIIRAGERGAQLARQLLTFSRREVVQPRVVDLNGVVSDMHKMLSRTIPATVQLTTTLAPRLWKTRIDPGQIEQIIMNLAVNAKDAMPGGGRMTISTANVDVGAHSRAERRLTPGEYVCLTVADTGSGMTKEVLGRVFEPFFTTKSKGDGTGLGLATVYGIVEQAHGHVLVDSELGKGTTFSVYLPRTSDDLLEEETVTLQPTTREGDGKVILVAEDEDAVRELVVRILRRNGYTVLAAPGGVEAVKAVENFTNRIDLLLTDVVMPDVSGKEVSSRTGLPTLFMSGYTHEIIAEQGVLPEDQNLLQKPFSAEELLAAVREVLRVGRTALR